MPQMAPMSWLSLFFYFTIMFLMFNSMNYYMKLYSSKKTSKSKKSLTYNWKW